MLSNQSRRHPRARSAMPVGLICPACGTAATFHRPPVTVCPTCQASLPRTLRQSAEASLLKQKAPRPLLLTIGLYLAPTFGAACLFAVLAAAFDASFVKFTINGDAVTGHEFLRTGGPAFFVLGVLALAIAYSIWEERLWTRLLVLGFWAAGLGSASNSVRPVLDAPSVERSLSLGGPPIRP